MFSRKRFLALLGAGASFVVLASLPTSAYAANKIKTFSPSDGWSVNRVDPRNGGSPYCTLARSFEGNMVITFARNTDGEGTVAIDFQQPLFEPNQTYRIALQAGNGLKREFLTRPATPNALVLRTGQDPQFFSALSGSADMGVIFDNGRYAFSIPDFSKGEAQLAGCIGDSPAVMPRTPAVNVDNAALAQLRSEIDALKQENESIAASLRQGVGTAAQSRNDLADTSENDALLKKLSSLESEKTNLVEKLQNERSRQQQDAQDEETLRQALEDQKALKQMLESERSQRAQLESALTEKTAEAEKRGELRARIQQLETSNVELKSLRETLDAERNKRLAVEKQLQEQKAKSAATLEGQELLRTRVSQLEKQNETLQQTATRFEDTKVQLQSTQSRAMEEQARREAAEQALKEVQLTASQREARLATLQSQMELERSKLESSLITKETQLTKQHSEEVARLNLEIEQLKTVGQEKERLSQNYTSEQTRRAAVEKALFEAKMAIGDKENKIAALQSQMELERSKLERSMATKETQLTKQHSEEVARLNLEIEQLKTVGAEKDKLAATITSEQARRAAVEKALNEAQLANLEKEKKLSQLQAQMEVERKNLEKAETQKQVALSMKHSEELGRLNAEVEKLRAVGIQREELAQGYTAEFARRAAAEKVLNETRAELQRKDTERDALMKQLEVVRAEAAKARVLEQDNARMQETAAKLSQLEMKNLELMDQVQSARARTEAAERAAAQTVPAAESQARLADIQQKADIDKRELQTLLEAEKARRTKLEQMAATGSDADARLRELETQMGELAKRNTDLEEALKKERENQPAIAADGQLKKQLEAMKADNLMLAEKLQKVVSAKPEKEVIYATDDKVADVLAETKTSLASAVAERDEYRNLLQRERLDTKTGANPQTAGKGVNAQIIALEEERVELIRQLEFERARNEQIAAGKEVPPASGRNEKDISKRLVALEEEKLSLKKQLQIAQQDILDARTSSKPFSKADPEIAQLIAENKKLMAELSQSEKARKTTDTRTLETEIASLRAQNNVLSAEVNKRLAAAPTRAAMDNAAAEADFKMREADKLAQQKMDAQKLATQNKFAAVEAENIRLAQALAAARNQPQPVKVVEKVIPVQDETRMAAMEAENIRLAQELAKAQPAPVQAQPVVKVVEKIVPVSNPQDETRMAAIEAENIRLAQALAQAQAKPVVAPIVDQQDRISAVVAAAQPQMVQTADINRVAYKSLPPVPQAQPSIQQPAAPVATAVYTPVSIPADTGPSGKDIENYLRRAGIPMVSGIEKIRKVSGAQFSAFRWDTGVVFGTAEQQVMPRGQGFDDAVNAYLQKTKDRCSGTFDQSFDAAQAASRKNFAVADVACVMPDGMGAGAAVLFFYKDGMFNVVAHEGEIRQFEQAMNTRDTLARFMDGSL